LDPFFSPFEGRCFFFPFPSACVAHEKSAPSHQYLDSQIVLSFFSPRFFPGLAFPPVHALHFFSFFVALRSQPCCLLVASFSTTSFLQSAHGISSLFFHFRPFIVIFTITAFFSLAVLFPYKPHFPRAWSTYLPLTTIKPLLRRFGDHSIVALPHVMRIAWLRSSLFKPGVPFFSLIRQQVSLLGPFLPRCEMIVPFFFVPSFPPFAHQNQSFLGFSRRKVFFRLFPWRGFFFLRFVGGLGTPLRTETLKSNQLVIRLQLVRSSVNFFFPFRLLSSLFFSIFSVPACSFL